jgi:nucleoside-diphosphate-sugar epimerase
MSRDEKERERFFVKKLLKLKNKQGFDPYKQKRCRIIIEFINRNITYYDLLQKTFKERGHVFHAATVASVPEVFIS